MTESSISTETKTRPHKTAHAQIYDWQLVRLRQAGNRGSLAIEILIKLAEKVGRGAKPSDPWYSPSIETLAKSLIANERSIRRSIGLLARHGLIEITKSQNGRNLYRLSTSPDEAERWQAATASTLCKGHARRVADNSKNGGATCPPRADIFVHPERTYSSNRADIFVQPSGHIRPAATNDPPIINATNIDNNDEKQTKKTEPIRQYLHTKESDNYYHQTTARIESPTRTYEQTEPENSELVVVENVSSSNCNPTAGQPLAEEERITHINSFGWETGQTLDTLRHYGITETMPHIEKALKDAIGIPRRELGEAIQWAAKDAISNGGLAWFRIGKSFVKVWELWKVMDNERKQQERAQLESAAMPERIIERTSQAIAQVEVELEKLDNDRRRELEERAIEGNISEQKYEKERRTHGIKRPNATERYIEAHKESFAKYNKEQDEKYENQLAALKEKMDRLTTEKQKARALLEAA